MDYIVFDTNDFGWWRKHADTQLMNNRGTFGVSWYYETGDRYAPFAEQNWRL